MVTVEAKLVVPSPVVVVVAVDVEVVVAVVVAMDLTLVVVMDLHPLQAEDASILVLVAMFPLKFGGKCAHKIGLLLLTRACSEQDDATTAGTHQVPVAATSATLLATDDATVVTANPPADPGAGGNQFGCAAHARQGNASAVLSSPRCASSAVLTPAPLVSTQHDPEIPFVACSELNSHANTCCAGNTMCILKYTGQTCDVAPFLDSLGTTSDIPVVKAATAYDDPITSVTYILIFHQALYFGNKLDHNLICPNQLCANGLVIADVPTCFDASSTHSIYAPTTTCQSRSD